MKTSKPLVVAVLAIAIAGPIVVFLKDSSVSQQTTSAESPMSFLHGLSTGQSSTPAELGSLERAIEWINSPPVKAASLRGKVVLVDFWEYTCINCLRTLPYLKEWYKRYAADGFVIVGVHTNEFPFSGEPKNVEAATKRLGVTWPVALDDKDVLWNRYSTNTWPHELLFDQTGKRIESVIGEGSYPETETHIQALLKAANPSLKLPPIMALLPQDSYDKPGAVCYPQTAETYVGGQRAKIANTPPQAAGGLGQQQTQLSGMTQVMYYDRGAHQDGGIYLQGPWRKGDYDMTSGDGRGHVAMKYHAIQVVAVMRPESGGAITVLVTQNDKPVAKEDAGADIQYDAQGRSYIAVSEPRAYDVIMNKKWGTYDLSLAPQASGLGMYSFDFESCEAGSDK